MKKILSIMIFALAISSPLTAGDGKALSKFAPFDGMRIHYTDSGKGPEAIVFVHGWSCNLDFWKSNIPAFTGSSRVIAIDLPGHGQSDKPETTYSMDLFARAIDAVMTQAGVERATLVGHSMGTPVIRQFYRLQPKKTRALVIVDGALRPFGTRESMEPMIAQFRSPDYRKAVEGFVGFLAQSSNNKALLDQIRDAMLATPQHVVVGAMEGMLDPAIWGDDKITVPTLAIMAKNDQAWTPEYEKYVRELAPGIEYSVWDGVSHFLMMDDPDRFNRTVMEFMKKRNLVK